MTRTLTRRLAAVGGALSIAVLAGIGTASADATEATAAPNAVVAQQDAPAWNGDHGTCDDWCGRHHHDGCDGQGGWGDDNGWRHGGCDGRDNGWDNGWGDRDGDYYHHGVLTDLVDILL
jgi:hypothetical protein